MIGIELVLIRVEKPVRIGRREEEGGNQRSSVHASATESIILSFVMLPSRWRESD